MPNFVSLGEAADYLGVSRNTLRNWDQNGKLVASRNPKNGYRRYDMNSLASIKAEIDGADPQCKCERDLQRDECISNVGEERVSRSVRAIINRLHCIIRDSDASSNIMDRFDEISKVLFVWLLDDSLSTESIEEKKDVHVFAERIRKRYIELLNQNNIESFGRTETILLSDDCLARCARLLSETRLPANNSDIKGFAYEEVIRGTFDKSDNQQFFTPSHIVDFMVSMFINRLSGIVCDPACGTASFLISAARTEAGASYLGFEIDSRLSWVSQLNLCLHGIANGEVLLLGEGGALGFDAKRFFSSVDVILTNPPFGSDYTDQSILSQYILGKGKKSRRRGILFIEQSWNLLKPGGVAAIIIDQGVLTSTSTRDVREFIKSHFNILAIIDLPDSAFMPYAAVSTSILFLEKRSISLDKYCIRTFFAKANNVGRRANGDEDFVYDEDGNAKLNTDLDKIINEWRRFNLTGAIESTNEVYVCNLDSEAFDNPEIRLDFSFHHPMRLKSLSDIEHSLYPLVDLGEICTERNVTYVPSADPDATTIMLTGLANIEPNNGHAIQVCTAAASIKSGVKRYEKNDIIFAKMRPSLRKVALMPFEGGGYASNECAVFSVMVDENGDYIIDPRLLSVILRSNFVYGQIVHLIQGSGRPRISNRNLRHIKIPIIPKVLQERFIEQIESQTKVVTQMKKDAAALLREASKLEETTINNCIDSILGDNND